MESIVRPAGHHHQNGGDNSLSQQVPLGSRFNSSFVSTLFILLACVSLWLAPEAVGQDKAALIRDALSASPPAVAKTARVVDANGSVLRPGTGSYTCYPTMPELTKKGKEPMCLDKTWIAWRDAWMNRKPFQPDQVGIGYMLAGDTGASNTDPYAQAQTSNNHWVVEGPHTMIIVPDPALLESLSADPHNGGAYVMWRGTPYVHIMVPVGPRPGTR